MELHKQEDNERKSAFPFLWQTTGNPLYLYKYSVSANKMAVDGIICKP
jgi:hypothetical protein